MNKHDDNVNLVIFTDTLINGNKVTKDVAIDFKNNTFKLTIFWKYVDLDALGMKNDDHVSSVNHFKAILTMIERLKLCTGISLTTGNKKKAIPQHIRLEDVSEYKNETSEPRIRSRSCIGVLGWLCTLTTCETCQRNLRDFSNEENTKVQVSDKEDDFKSIVENILPTARLAMKTLLVAQFEALGVSDKRQRRWDQDIIKVSELVVKESTVL